MTLRCSTGQRMVERVSRLDTDIHSLETVRDDAAHKAAPPSDCEDPEREMLREIASYSPLLIQYIQGCIDFTDAQVCGQFFACVHDLLLFRQHYRCHPSRITYSYICMQARCRTHDFNVFRCLSSHTPCCEVESAGAWRCLNARCWFKAICFWLCCYCYNPSGHVVFLQFIEHLAALYPLFVELLRCGSRDVRRVLHAIFQDRIPKLLPGSISGSMPAQSGATPK